MDNLDLVLFIEQGREIGILKAERDKLRAELINLFRVVESGDWNTDYKVLQIDHFDAEIACDRAEKLIAETGT